MLKHFLLSLLVPLCLIAQDFIPVFEGTGTAGGDGITKTLLTTGSADNDYDPSTASISPTADSWLYLFACFAATSGSPGDLEAGASGPTGVTWTEIGRAVWGVRRKCSIIRGDVDGSPGSGAVTLDCWTGGSCNGSADGTIWSIIQFEGLDDTTPNGTVTAEGDDTTESNPSVSVSGTPDTGDWTYNAFGWEDGDTLSTDSDFGDTDHNTTNTDTGVRQIIVGTNQSPPASPVPDISGSGSNHSFESAFILNVAP